MPLKRTKRNLKLKAENATLSQSPNGKSFPLPKPGINGEILSNREAIDKVSPFIPRRLEKLVAAHRKQGREIVVVMGVGFVGAVMAGVIADSTIACKASPLIQC